MSVPASIAQPHAAASVSLVVDYYLDGDVLIIASLSIPGRLYVTTSKECSCPAGLEELPCKHAELRLRLLRPQPTFLNNAMFIVTLDQEGDLY
jgi:hypothetical protein